MIIKTRDAYTQELKATWDMYNASSGAVTHSSKTGVITQGGESISYDVGPRYSRTGLPNLKVCTHYHQSRLRSTDITYRREYSATLTEQGSVPLALVANRLDRYFNSAISSSWSTSASESKAGNGLLKDINLDVPSMTLSLENLAGIVSGKSIFKALQSLTYNVWKLRTTKRILGKYSVKDAFQVFKSFVGLDLWRKFSAETTIRDGFAMLDSISEYRTWLEAGRFRQDPSRPYVKCAGSSSGRDAKTATQTSGYASGYPTNCYPKQITYEYGLSEQYNVFGYYRLHYADSYFTRANYATRALGFNRPLSTIWAILPMSFFVDYLAHVQDFLEWADLMLDQSQVGVAQLTGVWCCKKRTYFAEARNSSTAYSGKWHLSEAIARREQIHFSRYPIETPTIGGWTGLTSGLSLSQSMSAFEVALQILTH